MTPMMRTAGATAVAGGGPGASAGGQFGVDTTRTKVFVGGLAWETRKDAVRGYFQRFGHILEAVVITDKATGRSKGYGFVTFKEPEAAKRACADPAPVIDGRRANCNLAVLGTQKPKPPTPKQAAGGLQCGWDIGVATKPSFGGLQCDGGGGLGAPFPSAAAAAIFPHYAIQQGVPYNVYGYPPYYAEYAYNTNCYAVYGGAGASVHYPLYGGWTAGFGAGSIVSSFYPYIEQENSGSVFSARGQGYSLQFPCMHHFSMAISGAAGVPQHFIAPMSISTSATTPGMATALPAPTASRLPHPYGLASTLTAPVTPKQLLA